MYRCHRYTINIISSWSRTNVLCCSIKKHDKSKNTYTICSVWQGRCTVRFTMSVALFVLPRKKYNTLLFIETLCIFYCILQRHRVCAQNSLDQLLFIHSIRAILVCTGIYGSILFTLVSQYSRKTKEVQPHF